MSEDIKNSLGIGEIEFYAHPGGPRVRYFDGTRVYDHRISHGVLEKNRDQLDEILGHRKPSEPPQDPKEEPLDMPGPIEIALPKHTEPAEGYAAHIFQDWSMGVEHVLLTQEQAATLHKRLGAILKHPGRPASGTAANAAYAVLCEEMTFDPLDAADLYRVAGRIAQRVAAEIEAVRPEQHPAMEEILKIRDAVIAMVNAIGGNPAARAFLGLGASDDFVVGIKRWAESYRPESFLDMKEALSAALRRYRTAHENDVAESDAQLWEIFGVDKEEGEEEIDRLADHLAEAVAQARPEPAKPTLGNIRSALAIWMNDRLGELREQDEDELSEEQPPVISHHEAGQRPPGWSGKKTRSCSCAESCRWLQGSVLGERWHCRLDAEKLEETGVARFDPTDPEAVLDTIIELGARITVAENNVENIVAWSRSCAGLPANEEALRVVTALVEKAEERIEARAKVFSNEMSVRQTEAWQLASNAHDRISALRRSYAHLPADAEALAALVDEAIKRTVEEYGIKDLVTRVQALELHDQGRGWREFPEARP